MGIVCLMARRVSGSNLDAESCRSFSDSFFRGCPQFTFFTCCILRCLVCIVVSCLVCIVVVVLCVLLLVFCVY